MLSVELRASDVRAMRVPILLSLGLFLPLTACRDREEVALSQLEERGYSFAVSAYHGAAANGDVPAVIEYLEAGMAVDVEGENGLTAFQNAASEDHDELVRVLIEAGASPDQRLANGRTMLMRVADRVGGDLRMLEFLLENRADPLAVDSSGMTSLMVSALAGNVDGVRRLSERDVRSLDKALMLASAQGYTHCLEVLIERGAYVNCRSHDTQTPLMYAAGKGHMEATQLLLRHHANRFALDDNGRTAADRAEAANLPALAAILRDTSNLLASGVPANNEFLPSLDGQLIVLLSEPMMNDVVGSLDPIEPERPVLEESPDEESMEESDVDPANPRPPTLLVKPVIIKNGEPIGTSSAATSKPVDLQTELQLGRFEERFEPLLVTDVDGDKASMRLLGRPPEEAMITVLVGQRIPNTSYEVTRVNKRVRPTKGGGMLDISEVYVKSSQKDGEQRFVRNTLPRDEATHLVVEAKRSKQRFAARLGDVFTIAETQESYTVTDVRPHQLLIRNEETQEILTIDRH